MGMAKLRNLIARVLCAAAIFCSATAHPLKDCGFDRIYVVGDSLSDTGNFINEFPKGANSPYAGYPYGRTFFNSSTGRCSDGLLIIDYIALSAGLPPLPAYKGMDTNFNAGVNFAVAGASALSSNMLLANGIINEATNNSLDRQMKWLMNHLNFITLDSIDLADKIRTALFFVQIGGNDYNYGFLQGRTIPQLESIVPQVVGTIIAAAQKLIQIGALKIVIPGLLPNGCLPIYKTLFKSDSSDAYDAKNCLKNINDAAKFHEKHLQKEIRILQIKNPHVAIVYGDYYNAYLYLLKAATERGYNSEQSCCGIGGEYNFNMAWQCGAPSAEICDNPSRYLSWDGTHLTQSSYQIMARWLLSDMVPKLKCHADGAEVGMVRGGRSATI